MREGFPPAWRAEWLLEQWDAERQWDKTPEEKVEHSAYKVCHTLDRAWLALGEREEGSK